MTRIAALMFVWIFTLIFRVGSSQSLDRRNFRCDNGKYIRIRDFCDRTLDCGNGDKSDESYGCDRDICGAGKFYCGSDRLCIGIEGRCNTIKECPDGFDELNCGHENDVGNCSLSEGKYLCQDRLKCLDFIKTCDGDCNCFDCSDETALCKQVYIPSGSCDLCPQYCLPTPQGPQCVCSSNKTEPNEFCKAVALASEIRNTSDGQRSVLFKNTIKYLCYENYHEIHQPSGIVKCRNDVWLGQVLLYSTTSKIKMMNITTLNRTEIVQNAINCTSLTAAKEYLYYSTYHNKKGSIFKVSANGGKSEKIIEFDSTIKSLAADWITGNLYFTSNKSLLVCSNNGRICTRLKCCGIDYVALAPKFGWMFYTYNEMGDNEQLIMKSNLDGSEEKSLIDRSFHYPISLAVDEWTEIVYYFEADKKELYSLSLNGSIKNSYWPLFVEYKFSIHFSILERYAFFIKENHNEIYNSTFLEYDFTTFSTDYETNNIRNLFTYNPHMQITSKIENPCTASSCNGLCLLSRADSLTNRLNYTCISENFIPSDDNSCSADHPGQLNLPSKSSTKNEASQINLSTEPMSTSTSKNYASTTRKPSTVHSSPPQSP